MNNIKCNKTKYDSSLHLRICNIDTILAYQRICVCMFKGDTSKDELKTKNAPNIWGINQRRVVCWLLCFNMLCYASKMSF